MQYKILKDYAGYLRENHLDSFVDMNINKAREVDLPLLKVLEDRTSDKLRRYVKEGVLRFLNGLQEGDVLDDVKKTVKLWKTGRHREVSRGEVFVTDIVQVYRIRKDGMIHWLDSYTSSISTFKEAVLELEDLYSRLLEYTFSSFMEVQKDIQEQEKELRETVLNSSYNSIVALKPVRGEDNKIEDFTYELVNDNAEEHLGINKSEIIGQKLLSVYPSVVKEGIFDLYVATVEEGKGFDKQFYYDHENFRQWLRQSGTKWRDGLVVTTINITPLKESQEKLEAANKKLEASREALRETNQNLEEKVKERTADLEVTRERFNMLSQATNDIIYDQDLAKDNIWWNEAYTTILGYPATGANTSREKWYERLHPDDRERVKANFRNFINKKQKQWKDKYRFRHKDGSYKVIFDRGLGVYGPNGELTRIVGSMLDVTDREEVERRLRELTENLRRNENQLRLITNATPAFISYIDSDLRYRFTNRYYQKLSFAKGDLKGKAMDEVLDQDAVKKALPVFRKVFEEGNQVSYQNTFALKDGNKIEVEVKIVPDKDAEGGVKGVVALGVDLTERTHFERKLESKNEELLKINSDLDNFIYTASHDLKAPVANFQGLINAVKEVVRAKDMEIPELMQILEMVDRSIYKFNNTISELAEISKVQRDVNGEAEEVDIGEIIDDVKESVSNLISETGAKISVKLPEDCRKIRFSRLNLTSIFYNLISNGIKYRAPDRKPEIDISCECENGYYRLTVKDNGMGIPEKNLDKIYVMFKRFHSHVEGSGIGLYIVKRVVENSGGSIEVDSKVDAGTTFTVCLKNRT